MRKGRSLEFKISKIQSSALRNLMILDNYCRANRINLSKLPFVQLVQITQVQLNICQRTAYDVAFTLWILKH